MEENILSPKTRILVVDDDAPQRELIAETLNRQGYEAITAGDGVEALEGFETFPPDVILTDLNMPRMDGIELLTELKERGSSTPVIALTAFGSVEKAVQIVHELNAFWFLEKPATMGVLIPLLERAVSQGRLVRETERLTREMCLQGILGTLVGKSAVMQYVFSMIRQVAPSNAAVLITGESGTGKELVAQEIHRLSRRSAGPFVAINCAALPETLIESELFGHEKGSFTGAVERRAGCFEQAHGGTLLLDEIGEMPLQTQSKLLRVLEDLKVRRLGAKNEIQVDCRVIAATNRAPEISIEKNQLREDLFYRLNVFRIELPPLRDRKDDIGPIAQSLIHTLNVRHGTRVTHLSQEALDQMYDYDWPGNVRELRNVVERAMILAGEGAIRPLHVRRNQGASISVAATASTSVTVKEAEDSASLTLPTGLTLDKVEEAYIRLTFRHLKENRRATAAQLGISQRTLQTKLGQMSEGKNSKHEA
jgi:DNA-binding NtrC family response regulator